jgi:hypothetical protein
VVGYEYPKAIYGNKRVVVAGGQTRKMPEIRFSVDEKQYNQLTEIKEKHGLQWKGLMLFGADELGDEIEVDTPDSPQFPGVTYDNDQRVFPDPADDRLAAFKAGWTKAANGETFGLQTYESLSWHNLGWRLGRLFDYNSGHDTSGELKREIYMRCVDQQIEASEERSDTEN